jgi:phosphohistidine phosphatase
LKTLYLLRHAKSDWNADFGTDFERPLNKRGRRAAEAVGEFLAGAGWVPDVALASSAVRTRDTIARAAAAGDWKCDIELLDELYSGNPKHIFAVLRARSRKLRSVMIVGHETAMSETTSLILGKAQIRFPTAAVACMELDIKHWKELEPGCGHLLFFLPPRLLV